jgi:opine dehydrogenase
MRIVDTVTPETVRTLLSATTREGAVNELVMLLAECRNTDKEIAFKDIAARDRAGQPLVPVGRWFVAIPHASTGACKQLVMAIGISKEGIPWEGSRRAHVVIVILCPPQTHALYLRVLSRIVRLCETRGFLQSLLQADSARTIVELITAAEKPLGEIVSGEGMPTFCVLGSGHGGMAMAAHLAFTGCRVNLFNRTPARIEPIRVRGGIDADGEISGFASLNKVTSDPAEAIEHCDVLMVVVPATAHRSIARLIAPHINDGQIIVLNPGRTGGAMELRAVLKEKNPLVHPYIAETETLLYAARATNPGQVHVFSIKNSVPLATLPTYHLTDILPVIRKALPQFIPGDDVLKTSLNNIGAVFHPAITILNAARIEDTHGEFQYYVEGVTPAVARILDAIDHERVAVAAALGIRANTAREWLYLAYDAAGRTLHDAMKANAGYSGIKAPRNVEHRYISEDVPASLVPIASIGSMLGVLTPTISTMIHLASVMHGVDYWAEGRTVERLGIQGMSVKDIRFLVMGAEPAALPTEAEPPTRTGKE